MYPLVDPAGGILARHPGGTLARHLTALTAAAVLTTAAFVAVLPAAPEVRPWSPPSLIAPATPAVVPNVGQADASVRFEARGARGTLFFTDDQLVLAQPPGVVRLRFIGANPSPALAGAHRQPGVVNHLRGSDPANWRTGVPTYAAVAYANLYPGVDARHAGDSGQSWISSTYTVAPHADPTVIRWRHPGAGVSVDPGSGDLLIEPRGGLDAVRQAAPVAWQRINGDRVAIPAAYHVHDDGSIGFVLGPRDTRHPLAIAVPAVAGATQTAAPGLAYSTYLGGSQWDEVFDAKLDAAGSAYVAGYTLSPDFPRAGARESRFGEVTDGFVARYGTDGRLIYSSYLGGLEADTVSGIAVDRRGNAFVTGKTRSADFPTRRALQGTLRGRGCQEGARCHDAFAVKLAPRGTIVYSTYLGGSQDDEGIAIAVDRQGRAYINGNTSSTNYPVRRAVQRRHGSRPCSGDVPCPSDVFVTRLSASGRSIGYSTYLGGEATERAGGIAVDRNGGAFLTGVTRSARFPTRNAFQGEIEGAACGPPLGERCHDAFVTRLSPSGRTLRFSTYFGGTENDAGTGIAVGRDGRVVVTGGTGSPDLPTAHPVQSALDNSSCSREAVPKELCDDAFVTRFTRNGRQLSFSTYLGGNGQDASSGVAVGRDGSVHVAGSTDSRTFPVRDALQSSLRGAIDVFATKYAPDGRSIVHSSYLGGSESERANAIAVDRSGNALLAGRTDSPDFPVANAQQGGLAGDIDGFVAKLE